MKKIIGLFIFATCLFSCAGNKTAGDDSAIDAGTKVYAFKDSCQHLTLSLSLELPLGEDSASLQIRDSLIADFINSVSQPGFSEEGTNIIKPYTGNMTDAQAIVDYYGKADYAYLLNLAKSDYEERVKYVSEDTTIDEETRQSILEDIPMWAYDLNVNKMTDTLGYVVYYSQAYVYYGGAHGGITGSGALTFDKSTGKKIERFIDSNKTKDIQPFIRKGLLEYYRMAGDTITDSQLSERLQIESKEIPLPSRAAFPNASGDSLTFVYGQYEIACYADGMPAFKLPIKDIEKYLTPEGKALLIK